MACSLFCLLNSDVDRRMGFEKNQTIHNASNRLSRSIPFRTLVFVYIVNRNLCDVFAEKDVGSNFVWIHETRLKLEVAFCTERTAGEDSKHATFRNLHC